MCPEQNNHSYGLNTEIFRLMANSSEGLRMSAVAEGVGFEPTRERKPPGGFQDRCLKPLGHPSIGHRSADRWTATAERTRARASRRQQGQVLQVPSPTI